jgi:hypothetical protein
MRGIHVFKSLFFFEVATIKYNNDHASHTLRFPLVIDDHQMMLTTKHTKSPCVHVRNSELNYCQKR